MIHRLLLAFVLTVVCATLSAQETRVVKGVRYTVHRVQAGQTLFAIARSYAVPVDALLSANPGANDGLSIGEELLVPLDAVVKKEAKVAPVLAADGELRHTVARKETLFGIARTYGVDINVLLERNPEAHNGLREGMVVVVPVITSVQGQTELATRPAAPENAIDHTVAPGETLFALGQRYGVPVEAIQKANGGLPEGLKTGAVITIPLPPGAVAPTVLVAPRPATKESRSVTFLLPFATTRNDSVLALSSTSPTFHQPTRIAAQFWGGAQIALDSLQREGVSASVKVMDLGDDARTWNTVLKDPSIGKTDLFIGPFHRTAIEQLARLNSKAHIVCPVPQSNKVILGHPTVSKVTPTRSDLVKHSARYVAGRHARENIILLRPEITGEKEMQDQMASALVEALKAQPARLRDTAVVARPNRRELGDLVAKLDPARLNVLIAPSEDVEYVTTLVGKLKPLAAKYRILLVGMESWQSMQSVAVTDLDLLDLHFASPTFADPADPAVRAFTLEFRERFNNDVDEYAFLGFDVTYHYIKALYELGPDFMDRAADLQGRLLHMGFRMTRTGPENGFRNEFAVMLRQKDLVLSKAP